MKEVSRVNVTNRYLGNGDQVTITRYYEANHRCKKIKPKKHFVFRWLTGNQSYVEGFMARITNEEQVSVVVKPVTPGNHPAKIDGDVVFTSSDDTVATVVSTGQFGAMVTAVGVGAAQITAVFDARLGDEVLNITLSGAVEVVDAEASNGTLEFGTPELQPPVTPPAP